MADHHGAGHKSAAPNDTSNATRSNRSSTLPSQQTPSIKPRHRHRHYNSLLYKPNHSHQHTKEAHSQTKAASNGLHLSPLGELLGPVKRNISDSLNGGVSHNEWESHKTRENRHSPRDVPTNPSIAVADFTRRKQRRAAAEKLIGETYNSVTSQVLSQHTTLAESRNDMLHMFSNLNATLSSLSRLQNETRSLLEILTKDSIPELTEESTIQLETFRDRISEIDSKNISKLQSQVDASRAKTEQLNDRLAKVRGRLQEWEAKEAEKDRRRRRRVGFVWAATGILLILVILLLIWGRWNERLEAQQHQPKDWTEIVIERERDRPKPNSSQVELEELLRSIRVGTNRNNSAAEQVVENNTDTEDNNELLSRIFDEL